MTFCQKSLLLELYEKYDWMLVAWKAKFSFSRALCMSLSPGAFMCLSYARVLRQQNIMSLLKPHFSLISFSLLTFKLSTSKLFSEREISWQCICLSAALSSMQCNLDLCHEPGLCFAGYVWDLRLSVPSVFQEGGSWILKTQLLMKSFTNFWQVMITFRNFVYLSSHISMKNKKKASCIVKMNLHLLHVW